MYIKKKPKKEDSRQVCIILALTLVSERNSTWKVNTSYNIANLKKKEDIYLFIYFKHILFTTKWMGLSNRLCLYKFSPFYMYKAYIQ
jgi:hypothetical protein